MTTEEQEAMRRYYRNSLLRDATLSANGILALVETAAKAVSEGDLDAERTALEQLSVDIASMRSISWGLREVASGRLTCAG